MEMPIASQLVQSAVSVLLGAALGLYYDVLRLPRLLSGAFLSAVMDLLFWLGTFFCLFCLGLGAGEGQLRLFMFLASGLGFALWEAVPGAFIRTGETAAAAFLKQSAQKRAARRISGHTYFKKVLKFLKNLFPSPARWFTIREHEGIPAQARIGTRRNTDTAANRGDSHEV